jgi:hypothetical protein
VRTNALPELLTSKLAGLLGEEGGAEAAAAPTTSLGRLALVTAFLREVRAPMHVSACGPALTTLRLRAWQWAVLQQGSGEVGGTGADLCRALPLPASCRRWRCQAPTLGWARPLRARCPRWPPTRTSTRWALAARRRWLARALWLRRRPWRLTWLRAWRWAP